jgi:threonine 3-dehydrogenase
MKALAKTKSEPGIWMIDAPVPEIGPKDLLVKIHRTGICGTDVHIYKWDEWAQSVIPVPMIVGHEFSGEIAAIGAEVGDFRIGQRVSGEGHVVGMKSRASRAGKYHLDPETKGIGVNLPGAFAEYLRIPAFNVIALPEAVDDEIGAILDPLGNAVHTVLAFDLVGEDVIITGAGPIGIMAAAVARQVGARHIVITDVNPERLALAAKVAPDVTPVNVASDDLGTIMTQLGMREGFDVGLEMSGAPQALSQMIDHLVMGGRVALLGVPARPFVFDLSKIVFRMVTLKGIYGREMFETWHKMLAMLESGLDVRKIITQRMKADDYAEAFRIAAAGKAGKIVLEW